MLENNPTEGLVPSMSERLVTLVIKWKRSKAGTQLLEQNGAPVLDLEGNPIYCDGKWKSPKCMQSLMTTVNELHVAHGHAANDHYKEACSDCMHLYYTRGNANRCPFHAGSPVLFRWGQPSTSNMVVVEQANSSKAGQGYEANGDSPFLPCELIALRKKYISSNSVFEHAFWT
ncbi:hypothetical protein HDU77_011522 [Chytriomyces hyalinus]|nr:hypothetical protein HDU77_011522 [Chytriomyces hyalinus]